MIGKLVYLQYLRQRNILSDARLGQWNIQPNHAFTREAKLESFVQLVERVDEWLNGSVFPLTATAIRKFGIERLRKLLGTA